MKLLGKKSETDMIKYKIKICKDKLSNIARKLIHGLLREPIINI